MKFQLLIAMCALIGFSYTSAAAVDFGDKGMPDSMEGFKESLRRLVLDVSEQIKENAAFDENMDLEQFLKENKLDDEEASIVTEEEGLAEQSLVEDDRSTENGENGLRCTWHGISGHCCQTVLIYRVALSICISVDVIPPFSMRVALSLNGVTIWRHLIVNHRRYNVCLTKGFIKLCILIHNLSIGRHQASACLSLSGKIHLIHFSKHLGCFHASFANNMILTDQETPLSVIENKKISKMQSNIDAKRDNVLRFHK